MRETTVPHQLLLLRNSTRLSSRPLNHIREETTEGIHAQAHGSTTQQMAIFLSRFIQENGTHHKLR